MLSRRSILLGIVAAGFLPSSAIAAIDPIETKPIRPWRLYNILNENRVWWHRVIIRIYFLNNAAIFLK